MRIFPADAAGIAAALHALGAGELIVHPTETVVSLSGDPHDASAVLAARHLKGSSAGRPFLCLVASGEAARALAAEWPSAAARLAAAFWPGPLTLIVQAGPSAPASVVAGGTLALRPASDPVSIDLLAAWDGPLFSTSANRAGEPPAVGVPEAARALGGAPGGERLTVALDGPIGSGQPSTVVAVTGPVPRLVRVGAIPVRRLLAICPDLQPDL